MVSRHTTKFLSLREEVRIAANLNVKYFSMTLFQNNVSIVNVKAKHNQLLEQSTWGQADNK